MLPDAAQVQQPRAWAYANSAHPYVYSFDENAQGPIGKNVTKQDNAHRLLSQKAKGKRRDQVLKAAMNCTGSGRTGTSEGAQSTTDAHSEQPQVSRVLEPAQDNQDRVYLAWVAELQRIKQVLADGSGTLNITRDGKGGEVRLLDANNTREFDDEAEHTHGGVRDLATLLASDSGNNIAIAMKRIKAGRDDGGNLSYPMRRDQEEGARAALSQMVRLTQELQDHLAKDGRYGLIQSTEEFNVTSSSNESNWRMIL